MSAKPQMQANPAERRRAAREVLAHPPKGKLELYTRFQRFEVVEIRDVSPFGLGLRLNAVIDDDAPVRVLYTHRGLRLDLSGTVVWKQTVRLPGTQPHVAFGCWVGVFLHPDNLDANFILHQALKDETD